MHEPPPESPPDPATAAPARPAVPGTVLAMVILAGVSGGWQALAAFATAQTAGDPAARLWAWVSCLIGLLFVGLGLALYRRRRWARTTVMVLSVVGLAMGALNVVAGSTGYGLQYVVWTTVYLVLLSTRGARSWFRRPAGPTAEGPAPQRPIVA
jgi:hypothetical protein